MGIGCSWKEPWGAARSSAWAAASTFSSNPSCHFSAPGEAEKGSGTGPAEALGLGHGHATGQGATCFPSDSPPASGSQVSPQETSLVNLLWATGKGGNWGTGGADACRPLQTPLSKLLLKNPLWEDVGFSMCRWSSRTRALGGRGHRDRAHSWPGTMFRMGCPPC